jgi:probable selenium-dependent hydroxylase accessory protein YqeC
VGSLPRERSGSWIAAFGIAPGQTVAAIGGGGKMSLLGRLAREWAAAGGAPLLTPTTRIFGYSGEADVETLLVARDADRRRVMESVRGRGRPGVTILLGRRGSSRELLEGLSPEEIRAAEAALPADLVLVKADGARGQSLKAHRDDEPVVPPHSNLVLAVVGIGGWGQPISERTVHRVEIFCERWGYAPGEPLDDEAYLLSLSDPAGYRKGTPASARYLAFLNQADDDARVTAATRIAKRLAERGIAALWGDAASGRLGSP